MKYEFLKRAMPFQGAVTTTIRTGDEQSKLFQSICEAEVAQRFQDLPKIQFNLILS